MHTMHCGSTATADAFVPVARSGRRELLDAGDNAAFAWSFDTKTHPKAAFTIRFADDQKLGIRLHDLRHSMATISFRDRENVKVVSERLGHASVTVTLSVYAHVLPGDQRQTAARLAALVAGRTHEQVLALVSPPYPAPVQRPHDALACGAP